MADIIGEAVVRIRAETSDVEQNIQKITGIANTEGQRTGDAISTGIGQGIEDVIVKTENLKAELQGIPGIADGPMVDDWDEELESIIEKLFQIQELTEGLSEEERELLGFTEQEVEARVRLFELENKRAGYSQRQVKSSKDINESVRAMQPLMVRNTKEAASLTEQLDHATAGSRKFVGSISGIAGIWTGIAGVVGLVGGGILKIFQGLKNVNEESYKFSREIQQMQLDALLGQFDKLGEKADTITGHWKDKWLTMTDFLDITTNASTKHRMNLLSEEIAYRVKVTAEARQRELKAREDQDSSERKAEQQRLLEAQASEEAARIAILDGEEKINAQRLAMWNEFSAKIDAEKDRNIKASLERERSYRNQAFDNEIEAFRKAESDKTAAAAEEAKKRADKEKKIQLDAVRETNSLIHDIMDRQTSMEAFTTGVTGLLQKIDARLVSLDRKSSFAGVAPR